MAAGYLTDVEYTGDFHDHLAPVWLAYIAAINGYSTPPLNSRFTWCELGCGKGVTSLLLAAAYPQGEFHACDFNPVHIDYAERLRGAGGIGNVRFHAKSFREMLDAALPAFDFIAIHGVYSWVPDEVRGEIREFIQRRLKPGGLVSVSYNAMPGWAHLQPIRRMMNAYASSLQTGDSLERARQAYAYVDCLARSGAGYFAALPAAAQHLKEIATQDIRYVAHEYLTPYGDPFYFSEVNAQLQPLGLSFAGSMTPEDNYISLSVPAKFQKLLAEAPSREMTETNRDFIVNRRFRRDLYAAQPPALQPHCLSLDRFDALAFCLTNLPERLALKNVEGLVRFDLESQADQARAVHRLLEAGPAHADAIHSAGGMNSRTQTAFLIQQLVIARHIAPCPPSRASAGWTKLNSALVDSGINEKLPRIPLACPHTGSASYTEVVNAATIEAAARFDDAQSGARNVLDRLRRGDHPLDRHESSGEKRQATDDEVLEYVGATWRALNNDKDPNARLLRLLGVLV
jgi:SAM-dependent methyltransferase